MVSTEMEQKREGIPRIKKRKARKSAREEQFVSPSDKKDDGSPGGESPLRGKEELCSGAVADNESGTREGNGTPLLRWARAMSSPADLLYNGAPRFIIRTDSQCERSGFDPEELCSNKDDMNH